MMEAKIISNGSKWAGQPPDPLEKLEEVLKKYKLEDWSYMETNKDGSVLLFGNFIGMSHVFQIILYDEEQIMKFQELFNNNKQSA